MNHARQGLLCTRCTAPHVDQHPDCSTCSCASSQPTHHMQVHTLLPMGHIQRAATRLMALCPASWRGTCFGKLSPLITASLTQLTAQSNLQLVKQNAALRRVCVSAACPRTDLQPASALANSAQRGGCSAPGRRRSLCWRQCTICRLQHRWPAARGVGATFLRGAALVQWPQGNLRPAAAART